MMKFKSETARAMMSQNVLVDEDLDDVWEDAVEFLEETVPAALEKESVAEKVNEIVAYVLTARILDEEPEVRLPTPKRGSSYRRRQRRRFALELKMKLKS